MNDIERRKSNTGDRLKPNILTLIAAHAICWCLYIFYEITSLYMFSGKLEGAHVYLIYYTLNILFFYAVYYCLKYAFDPFRRRYLKGLMWILIAFTAYIILKFFADHVLALPHVTLAAHLKNFRYVFFLNTFRGVYFFLLAVFYWASGYVASHQRYVFETKKEQLISLNKKAELEMQLSRSENAFLRQQINPHMLFNTLNFIYNSVYKLSREGARAVQVLSEIMRYSLQESDAVGKVNLADEIQQLRHLIEINGYRFRHQLNIETSFDGKFEPYQIPALILFTLAENVFKHGNLVNPRYPAEIHTSVDACGKLLFHTRNLKKQESLQKVTPHIGIKNLIVRLDFAYGTGYQLNVTDDADFFETTLIIDL